ncbi:MAG: glycosyltransferase [Vicinamibacterales bacterium]
MSNRPRTSGLTFAVVVPAYNEAADIGATCTALLALTPEPDEIVFVDDGSSDETVDIIRRYLVRPSIRLIVQPANRGPAAARNVGVSATMSDILVFVDADVLLPRDFLARLSHHYEQGADSVAVEAEVPTTEAAYERFFQAQHHYLYGAGREVGWSQAFSCRRSVAVRAGLFPEVLPVPGGEDGEFVQRISACTSRRVTDKTIVVHHITPNTLGDFWRQWQGRGVAVPFMRQRVHRVAWPRLVVERLAAAVWSTLLVVSIVPMLRRAASLTPLSARGWSDLPSFLGLSVLQLLAQRIGEWKGMFRLYTSRPSDAR